MSSSYPHTVAFSEAGITIAFRSFNASILSAAINANSLSNAIVIGASVAELDTNLSDLRLKHNYHTKDEIARAINGDANFKVSANHKTKGSHPQPFYRTGRW